MKYPKLYIQGLQEQIEDIENYHVIELHNKYITEDLSLKDYCNKLQELLKQWEDYKQEINGWKDRC